MKKTVLLSICCVLMSPIFSFAQDLGISASQWLEDLDQYQEQLEQKHINLYGKINMFDFKSELNDIKAMVGRSTDWEVVMALMKLQRKIGDGHTAISVRNLNMKRYPIEIKPIDGAFRVVKTTPDYEHLLGKKIQKIDGHDIGEVASALRDKVQFVENAHSEIERVASNMNVAEYLFTLGLTDFPGAAVFDFSEGEERFKEMLKAIPSEEFYTDDLVLSELKVGVREIQKPADAAFDYLWFAPIEGKNAVYLHFSGYPSYEEMEAFGVSLMTYIQENKITQVVIDLRNNGGGDYFVGVLIPYFINLCDTIDFENGVYCLTCGYTFSAATINAIQYRQMLNATIVGTPTGSNPTGYQDMDSFELANSKIVVTYSKRYFKFQEKATEGIIPDITKTNVWSDYKKGYDTVLAWVVRQLK